MELPDVTWLEIPGWPTPKGPPTVDGLALMEALQKEDGPDRLVRALKAVKDRRDTGSDHR